MDTRAFDPAMIVAVIPDLLRFLDVTLLVAITSIVLGSLGGIALAWMKLSKKRVLFAIAEAYIYIMRCTPSIVLLFIVFYGLPELLFSFFGFNANTVHRAVFAILTFTLLFSAYISEVFRAAYLAVPKGQYEAAVSIGLSPWQTVFRVVLPQAAVIALPNFGNATINLMKEGALAYTIGLIDLIGQGSLIIAQNFGAYGIETYTACMLIYWILTLLIEQAFARLERRLDKGQSFAVRDAAKKPGFLPNWMKGGEAHGA